MDSELQRIYDRMRLYFLLQDNLTHSTQQLADQLQRSIRWVQKWRKRLLQANTITLEVFRSRSRAPQHCPRQTSDFVRHLIADLRQSLSQRYHRRAGARLIAQALKHHPLLKDCPDFVPQGSSTLLKEMGFVPHKTTSPRTPVVRPALYEEWEMDFGEIRLAHERRLEFFIVIDRGSSRLVYVEGSMGYNAESALAALARLFVSHGMPQRLRFDRDPRFVGSWTGDSYPSAMLRFLQVLGVEPVICPPRRPDLKPFVERVIGTLKHEWLARFSLNSFAEALDQLEAFMPYYNYERAHFGSACQGKTPDDAFPQLPALPSIPESVCPDAWLTTQQGRLFRRRIDSNGCIQIDKQRYYIDRKRAKSPVLVRLDAPRRQFQVIEEDVCVMWLDIKGLQGEAMPFQQYLQQMMQEARSIEIQRLMTWCRYGEGA